jgi:hypothetical protein
LVVWLNGGQTPSALSFSLHMSLCITSFIFCYCCIGH